MATSEVRFFSRFSLACIEFVLRILALFPLRILRALGWFYGNTTYFLNGRSARTTRINLGLCYPEKSPRELKILARKSLIETSRAALEIAPLWYWRQSALEKLLVDYSGEDLMREKLAQGAVIAVCPHWGNWEYTTLALGARFPTTALFDDRRLGNFASRVLEARARFGFNLVPVSSTGLRTLVQALKDGQVVLVLPDQVPTRGSHVLVEFMGVTAQTTSLVHALAQRENVSVVVFTIQRVPKGFVVQVESANSNLMHAEVEVATQALNDEVARVVKRDPAQYQWEYKRFRRVPDRDVYRKI